MESKYEKQILEDIRSLPPNLLPKISKLIRFLKDEILSEPEKHPRKKKNFDSLEGIFHGQIKHMDKDIQAVQIKLKEIHHRQSLHPRRAIFRRRPHA